MGNIVPFPRHGQTSRDSLGENVGREMPEGQGAVSGQLSENHRKARSRRRTWMSAPPSMAASFLPSLKARELTVERLTPSSSAYDRAKESSCSILPMRRISVNLPHLSTAILPDAQFVGSGHITEMDLTALLSNIEALLRSKKMSASKASRLAGKPDAIRNIQRKVRDGVHGGVNTTTIDALAKVLGTTTQELISSARVPAPLTNGEDIQQELESLLAQRGRIDRRIEALEASLKNRKKSKRAKSR